MPAIRSTWCAALQGCALFVVGFARRITGLIAFRMVAFDDQEHAGAATCRLQKWRRACTP
jgi:hypothetical protein